MVRIGECFADNGPLKVLPGTHRADQMTSVRIEELSANAAEVTCEVPLGGAILMNPLLLHA